MLFMPCNIFITFCLYYKGPPCHELKPLLRKLANLEVHRISEAQVLFMKDGGLYSIVTLHKSQKPVLNLFHHVVDNHLDKDYQIYQSKQMY